jgi:WS/DGAT/MGAT family acyltransferase
MAGDDRLSFDDVQILRLESTAIRGHTGKLSVVEPDEDGTPVNLDQLRARIADRLDAVPRLRQRVSMPSGGQPSWEEDPGFDIANHVVEHEGDPVDDAGLRGIAGRLMGERLDHARPLWRLDLVSLSEGRTALFGRVHHCMADGVSVMRMLAGAIWDPPDEGKTKHARRLPVPGATRRPGGDDERSGGIRTLAHLPGAIGRELRPGAHSPLDRHIGARREVAWTSVPLEELKRIEHRAGEGVTVNDVILACVTGALRTWLEDLSVRPKSLKAQVPVSLHCREEGSGEVGNRDSFLFVDLPIGEPDPVARLRSISAETQERKHDHDAETLYSFFHSLSHFKPLYNEVTRLSSGPREFALSVSNVPGPRDPVTVLGRPVTGFSSFAEPADRHALRVAVVSLGGEVTFGLCSDPDAVGSLDRIAASLRESLEALNAGCGA